MKRLATLFAVIQAVFGFRVIARLLATAGGDRIERQTAPMAAVGQVSILVPVLNEVDRLDACLDGLLAQGPDVAEIIVADGGSTDGTQQLVQRYAARDNRLRLVDGAPVPADINGKAHGLQTGLRHLSPDTAWVLTIDADVRPDPLLARSLLAHAKRQEVRCLSVATLQRLSGTAEGLVHPSMLATLVYRFGIPGRATTDAGQVQANGQCMLIDRASLAAAGGFEPVLDSVCEDVTLARSIAARGDPVGFYEADGLVTVEMYAGWRDAWVNWTRSLPMRDRISGRSTWLGLTEILLAQALPLVLAPLFALRFGRRHPAAIINGALLMTRLGVLAGMARAYQSRPWTYWLSPLADLPVAARLWTMAHRRRHRWRGRSFGRGE